MSNQTRTTLHTLSLQGSQPNQCAIENEVDLTENVCYSLSQASSYAFDRQHYDGHWCGELKHDATTTAEVIMIRQALGLDMSSCRDEIISWFLSEQNGDGSWGSAPGMPGDINITVEAYFALKLLGVQPDVACMRRARQYTQNNGGIAKVRIFTRIYLAIFGLFPWKAVPELPAELILFPSIGPIDVYQLASWARPAIVPLLVISHHCPIFALPNGRFEENDYLDELWCNPANKMVWYGESFWKLLRTDLTASFFSAADSILTLLGGLRCSPTRKYALRSCIEWIIGHQEDKGEVGGVIPGLLYSILALHLEGHSLKSPPLHKAVQALERFKWEDARGKRYQSCKGPVWDSILMTIALCDAGVPTTDLSKTVDWISDQQSLYPIGDWRMARPHTPAGGFGFFYSISQYPDIDDTSAAIIALIKYKDGLRDSATVRKAVEWLLGMQNKDGGWGAFEADNDYSFWNKVPFSDMGALTDPSTADVSGRVLEAFGMLLQDIPASLPKDVVRRMRAACRRVVDYLATKQEATGAWYGRWGVNYIYGTGNVLTGLAIISNHQPEQSVVIKSMIHHGLAWLKAQQNLDGGWGETAMSYKDDSLAGKGPSTASQTAWALLALMAHCPVHDSVITSGVQYLLRTQTLSDENKRGVSWPTTYWTGTGFPGIMYLGYTFYSHYFPMMALGRYLRSVTQT